LGFTAGVVYLRFAFTTEAERKKDAPDFVRRIEEILAPRGNPVRVALTAWPNLTVALALPVSGTALADLLLVVLKTVEAFG
jgi:hypothetical protein